MGLSAVSISGPGLLADLAQVVGRCGPSLSSVVIRGSLHGENPCATEARRDYCRHATCHRIKRLLLGLHSECACGTSQNRHRRSGRNGTEEAPGFRLTFQSSTNLAAVPSSRVGSKECSKGRPKRSSAHARIWRRSIRRDVALTDRPAKSAFSARRRHGKAG